MSSKAFLPLSIFWNMRVVGVNCSLNVQCSSSPWRPMGIPLCLLEGESKKCFSSFLFVCFLYFPSIPPVTMISIQRGQLVFWLLWVTRNPHSPILMFHLLCQKDHAGLLLDWSLPFLLLLPLLLSFPLLCHLICGPIHTLLGAQISGSPSCIDICCAEKFLLLFMDVWLVIKWIERKRKNYAAVMLTSLPKFIYIYIFKYILTLWRY